jgi:hypothetical protein
MDENAPRADPRGTASAAHGNAVDSHASWCA